MILVYLLIGWILIWVYINTSQLLFDFCINIYDPISCCKAMNSVRKLKYLFFWNISYSNIIIFSPLLLESIKDESKIMSTLCTTIMNNYSMQVIRCLIHMFVGFFNLLSQFRNLLFHYFYLVFHIFSIVLKNIDDWLWLISR